MGSLKLPLSGKVYVDANLFIYSIEQVEPYLRLCKQLWEAAEHDKISIVTSELTLLEVLVKPLRDGNQLLASLYRNMFNSAEEISSVPISRSVLNLAGMLRAKHGLKTPDAIHAATGLQLGVVSFITNDDQFRRIPNLPVLVIKELV